MFNLEDITVIIPTTLENISESWLLQITNYCINDINVILIVPPKISKKIIESKKLPKDIKVIKSKIKGQVYQRQFGYKYCNSKLILHMDDDIFFDINSLQGLLKIFNNLPNHSCIAPFLRSNFVYAKNNLLSLLRNIFLYFDFKPKPGTISLTSFPIPHNFSISSKQTKEVDWLPGGISLLRKEDCIKKNYFHFNGKAYCEDLIHSYLLKKENVHLYLCPIYEFSTEIRSYRFLSNKQFFKYINDDFRIRNYYRKLTNKPIFPFFIAYLYLILAYTITRFSKKN